MIDRKNPTAVQIGQRIKQARKMSGMDTAETLLEKIPEWKRSRLGNYEAGISTPSPDDVRQIASATGASPCWIMFGAGPIRATGRRPCASAAERSHVASVASSSRIARCARVASAGSTRMASSPGRDEVECAGIHCA